jgi:hypothetical protein
MKGLSRTIPLLVFAVVASNALALDKSISESYVKVQAAVLKKDSKAMMQLWLAYVDPSCVSSRKGKVVTYKQMTDMVEPQMKMVKKVNSCKIQVVSSKTKAGKTICTVLTTQSFVINVGGKDSTFDQVTTVEDTWKKIGGKFKIVEIKTIKETLKQDGAIVPNN